MAEAAVTRRCALLAPSLDERRRRLVAAAEALAWGWGGITRVARATGVSRRTIPAGIAELRAWPSQRPAPGRLRRPGGGRTRAGSTDPTLREDLERRVAPVSRGDPESPLRWPCTSVRKLAGELQAPGQRVSHQRVALLLHDRGYSLQATRTTLAGGTHPDRAAQFAHLKAGVAAQLAVGGPAIAVDTKKKDLLGPFKHGGRSGSPRGGRKRGGGMPAWIPPAAAPVRTGATTWPTTPAGSRWGSTTLRPPVRWRASAAGGRGWASPSLRTRPGS